MNTFGNRKFQLGLGAFALLAIGFGLGQTIGTQPLAAQQNPAPANPSTPATAPTGDRTQRVVAYLTGFGSLAITREEFGDYLIDLYGMERIQLYVNKRIIEMACAKKGIDVTTAEIDAAILEDCKRINISKDDYVRTVLKQRYGKTLDEWRFDVMKPRLMLAKLCRDNIKVEEDELKKVYENRYGPKVRAKIIVWPKEEAHVAQKMYGEIRKGDREFDAVATKQADPALASRAGEVDPIGRYSGGESSEIENIAFSLKVGELSAIKETPFGVMVIKCIGHVDPIIGVDYEKVKPDLRKEVIERKLEKEIPQMFAKMRDEAKPVVLLTKNANPELTAPKSMK